MPRYYCDYCDTYLTHDSPSVRKQHNAGYKHKQANVRTYYQQYEAQLNQSLIDQKVKEHLGAFRPPAPYPQLRPGLPILPTPMPIPGAQFPGFRPPVLPRPTPGAPGYVGPPMPQMAPPPGALLPGQPNGLQMPASAPPPPTVPGSAGTPTSGGAPPMFTPQMYQGNAPVPTSGGTDVSNMNAHASETNQ
ncbi:U1 small nuclear ribonucleo C-like [Olea europaea subsp. europaea]|uniref:U1 small nuclear ribonucleoprotein C n=1 Tax=Olea europaea subsp. europaea TaxID=158383 RepID=A0A8S0R483_OLEEU|nr:U1 small nuclear ribonucleo C-like [Olea europaea subsp. europaea]